MRNLIEQRKLPKAALDLLVTGIPIFAKLCVGRMKPDREKIWEFVEQSLMRVTALVPEIGYDAAAKISKHACANDLTLREAALALGKVDAETHDRLVRPELMT